MKSPRSILICVLSGAENIGDELILASEIAYFRWRYPTAKISVATFDADKTRDALSLIWRSCRRMAKLSKNGEVVEGYLWEYADHEYACISYFPNHIKKYPFKNIGFFWKQMRAFWKHEMVVIGGGGIFFDNESSSFWKIWLEWIIRLIPLRLRWRGCMFLGVSLEMSNPKNLRLLRCIFRSQDRIFVRDRASQERLRSLGRESICLPDMAFLQPPKVPRLVQRPRVIGFALRGGFLSSQEEEYLRKIVYELHARGYEIRFLSHSLRGDVTHHDALFARSIFADDFPITQTEAETLTGYAEIDILVGMRFHSLLLSACYGIASIPLSYGSKTDSLIDELWLQLWSLRIGSWKSDDFWQIFERILHSSPSIQEQIAQKYAEIHHNLLQKLKNSDTMKW